MRIRPLTRDDLPRLKEMECEHEWDFESDFIGANVLVDENDVPVMIAGAWKKAEVHMVADAKWGTPAHRMAAFQQLHQHMHDSLKQKGYREAVTWFDRVVTCQVNRFIKRLRAFGWQESNKRSMHRGIY